MRNHIAKQQGRPGGEYRAVVIGVSAGGLNALRTILPSLSADFPAPVLIVQHISPDSDDFLSRILAPYSVLTIKEAEEKEKSTAGTIYFAPANYHLLVEEDFTLSLSVEERVNYARPAIDLLFETAAVAYGKHLVGIVLTGANHDGSQGLKKIKQAGGMAIVQDPQTAESPSMPAAAIKACAVDQILPLDDIGPYLNTLFTGRHG